MRHDWIFDVLSDLHSYAERNGLTELARAVDDALRVAREEIGPSRDDDRDLARLGLRPFRNEH